MECARSRETVKRSELAGWAQYGYCASHSRWFWGLRLHLVTTLHGLPVGFALAGAKADERQVLLGILGDPVLAAGRPGQVIIGDKGYHGRDFEAVLAAAGLTLLRPARKGEPDPACRKYFKPLRQVIESVNDTLKGQLDLEQHGCRTVEGVTVRVLQRILALTAAIWHNTPPASPSCAPWWPTTTDPLLIRSSSVSSTSVRAARHSGVRSPSARPWPWNSRVSRKNRSRNRRSSASESVSGRAHRENMSSASPDSSSRSAPPAAASTRICAPASRNTTGSMPAHSQIFRAYDADTVPAASASPTTGWAASRCTHAIAPDAALALTRVCQASHECGPP